MNSATAQKIEVNGVPFAVIPFADYEAMRRAVERLDKTSPRVMAPDEIPHEVVEMTLVKGFSLPKAWRIWLRMTQKEAAAQIGISQASLSRIEGRDNNHRATLVKIAAAYGIFPDQLSLDD